MPAAAGARGGPRPEAGLALLAGPSLALLLALITEKCTLGKTTGPAAGEAFPTWPWILYSLWSLGLLYTLRSLAPRAVFLSSFRWGLVLAGKVVRQVGRPRLPTTPLPLLAMDVYWTATRVRQGKQAAAGNRKPVPGGVRSAPQRGHASCAEAEK